MKKKTRRELADEAWHRTQQIELAAMEPVPQERTVPHFEQVPRDCPGCTRDNLLRLGWSLVFGDFLDCGNCGLRISVSRAAFEMYAKRVHDRQEALSWDKKKSTRGPKQRGAG